MISPNKITDLLLERLRQRPVYVNVHGEIEVFGYCVKERLQLLLCFSIIKGRDSDTIFFSLLPTATDPNVSLICLEISLP